MERRFLLVEAGVLPEVFLKVLKAKELLANTGASVGEVGRMVGYSHQSSFAEAFRRECGVAPSQWRNCPLR